MTPQLLRMRSGHHMELHMLHHPFPLTSLLTDHRRYRLACDHQPERPGRGIFAPCTWEATSLALTGDTCWSRISGRLELHLHTRGPPTASGPHCLPPSSTALIMWART